MTSALAVALALTAMAVGGCGDDDPGSDADPDAGSARDSGTRLDAGETDAGSTDAGAAVDSASPPTTTAHVYVTVSGDDEVVLFELDDDSGDLTVQQRIGTGSNPGALALSPDHSAVYVADRGDDAVHAFSRDADTGRLTDLGATTVGYNPVYLSVDSTGYHLLWASYGGDRIQSHPIATDGTVEATATTGFDTRTNPHAIPLDPSNSWAVVPNTNSDVIQVYAFASDTGVLTEADPFETTVASGTGPRHLDFHPAESLAYVINEHADSVTRFAFDSDTGALTETGTVSTLPESGADPDSNTCADIHVHPSGNWLYASNRGHDSIAVIELDASGAMTPRDYTPTEARPREFAVSPDGLFLIAAGQDSGNLAVYRIDPDDGSLTRIDTVAVGPTPMWVEIIDAP